MVNMRMIVTLNPKPLHPEPRGNKKYCRDPLRTLPIRGSVATTVGEDTVHAEALCSTPYVPSSASSCCKLPHGFLKAILVQVTRGQWGIREQVI